MRPVPARGILVVTALLLIAFPAAAAADDEIVGTARLAPFKVFPAAHAKSNLVIRSYDIEVGLNLVGIPRRHPRDRYFVTWLVADTGEAWIGGGVPTALRNFTRLGLVVPGKRTTAEQHVRSAHQLVITMISVARAKKLFKRAKRHGYRAAESIVGKRVVAGPVLPCSNDVCQDPVFPV